VVNVDICI